MVVPLLSATACGLLAGSIPEPINGHRSKQLIYLLRAQGLAISLILQDKYFSGMTSKLNCAQAVLLGLEGSLFSSVLFWSGWSSSSQGKDEMKRHWYGDANLFTEQIKIKREASTKKRLLSMEKCLSYREVMLVWEAEKMGCVTFCKDSASANMTAALRWRLWVW